MMRRVMGLGGGLLVACSAVVDAQVAPVLDESEPTALDTRPPPPPLPAVATPLTAGSWLDETPCPAPIATGTGYLLQLTMDEQGRLFGLGTSPNDTTLASLWRWDEPLFAFMPDMPCQPSPTWPLFQTGLFAYDESRHEFLAIGPLPGTVTFGEDAGTDVLYTKAVDSLEWTSKLVYDPWQTTDYRAQKLVRDEARGKVVIPMLPLLQRLDDSDEWTTVPLGSIQADPSVPFVTAVRAYDPARGLVVTVGGEGEHYVTIETEIDGTPVSSAGSGEIDVREPKLWWDPIAQRVHLAGIAPAQEHLGVWAWDAASGSWQNLDQSSAQSPMVRRVEDFAVDPTTGNVVFNTVVEGEAGEGEQPELWRFEPSGGQWVPMATGRWPTLWPKYGNSASAYDAKRDRLIVVTVSEQGPVEVTEWDGESQTFVDRTSDEAEPCPADMLDVDVAYDSDRERLMLLGYTSDRRELWEWNPETGAWHEPRATVPQSSLTPWPFSEGEASLVYDWAHQRLAAWVGELFTWDATTGLWERHGRPDYRNSGIGAGRAALVPDAQRGRLVLVTADGPGIAEWDGKEWSIVSTNHVSDVRPGLLATYDARSGRTLILLTSTEYDEASRAYLNNRNALLAWDGTELRDITPPALADVQLDTFSPSGIGTLTYDTRRGSLVLVGPIATASALDSPYVLHVWRGSTEAAP